ncbi:MAG: DUF2828 family protein [Solobacterium sp.]|nr:DUF2828 family protein [Solobacterium sp.]
MLILSAWNPISEVGGFNFASKPQLVEIKGKTLRDKIACVLNSTVGYSTDLEAAFELVLQTARASKLPQSEMPESIIVISDNEINSLKYQIEYGFVDEMKKRFADAGYTMPNLVLWNVASRQDTFHVFGETANVQLCTGQSASVFKTLTQSIGMSPYEYMLYVLSDPRYDAVTT